MTTTPHFAAWCKILRYRCDRFGFFRAGSHLYGLPDRFSGRYPVANANTCEFTPYCKTADGDKNWFVRLWQKQRRIIPTGCFDPSTLQSQFRHFWLSSGSTKMKEGLAGERFHKGRERGGGNLQWGDYFKAYFSVYVVHWVRRRLCGKRVHLVTSSFSVSLKLFQ